jgi:hypothetical protein
VRSGGAGTILLRNFALVTKTSWELSCPETAHAHIVHSIEWLYWGHVRIPPLKLRSPLIVLVRKVTSPGAVNFAGPV